MPLKTLDTHRKFVSIKLSMILNADHMQFQTAQAKRHSSSILCNGILIYEKSTPERKREKRHERSLKPMEFSK